LVLELALVQRALVVQPLVLVRVLARVLAQEQLLSVLPQEQALVLELVQEQEQQALVALPLVLALVLELALVQALPP